MRTRRVVLAIGFLLPSACSDARQEFARSTPRADAPITDSVFAVSVARPFPLGDSTTHGQLLLSAAGPRFDSVTVRLAIVVAGTDTAYATSWPSTRYFECDDDPTCSAAGVPTREGTAKVRAALAKLVSDGAFLDRHDRRWPWTDITGGFFGIRESLALQIFRHAHRLTSADSLSLVVTRAVIAQGSPEMQDATMLAAELQDAPHYWYDDSLGYCIVAYSHHFRRVFDVLCGP